MSEVERAEKLLRDGELREALLAFDRAEGSGAELARCCRGRWQVLTRMGELVAAHREIDHLPAGATEGLLGAEADA